MAPDRTASRVRELLRECRRLPEHRGKATVLSKWTADDWRIAFAELPLDASTFQDRFEVDLDELISELRDWRRKAGGQAGSLGGDIGLLMLTLICLRFSASSRSGADHEHDCSEDCEPLVADPDVQQAICRLYAPGNFPSDLPNLGDRDQQAIAKHEWAMVDPGSLRFHRHGTTSFILSGDTGLSHGRRAKFALKCLIYPYLRIPAIARATVGYRAAYGRTGDAEHMVGVWASGDSWILMDFVDGEQLDAYLERRLGREKPGLGLKLGVLEELGSALLSALEELEQHGVQHGDLSMSNILVVTRGDRVIFRLIDIGPNYLHTQPIPGAGGADRQYVAPEVRSHGADLQRADLYSLGRLLINFAGASGPPAGIVPDDFYSEAPLLARFVEDLVDSDPARRLVLFEARAGEPIYPRLKRAFTREVAAVRAIRKASLTHSRSPWYMHLRELVRPLSGVPAQQRRLWKFRQEHGSGDEHARSEMGHLRRLHFWTMTNATLFYLSASVIVMWWLRDLGLSWDTRVISLLQVVTGSSRDRLPLVDDIRAADYPIPDAWGSLPARIVALSFAFAAVKYYQNIFAGLTPLVASRADPAVRRPAVIAEFAVRAMTVIPPVLTLTPTLVQRDWWPICTALGITATFLCNLACVHFTRAATACAVTAGLTTVPREAGNPDRPDVAGVRELGDWTGSAAFYGVACWTIGLLIFTTVLRDTLVYALAVTAINVILFYVLRCGVNARYIRAGLVRSCLAAERLGRLNERRTQGEQQARAIEPARP
ncbi:protein kinase domain-containing protein [Saccharopolyspora taberi]|uniref:Protein kinase domain-containing protein n=1 Tax=Saccharopolyspora taberi TaxID=60895 RepID=A0ABN3VFW5_9PSEU